MLAQLVEASVGQAVVQRFEPHFGHNFVELQCVSCEVQALWAPSGTNHKAELAISLSARLLYKRGAFPKSIPEETRTITVPSLSGL